MSTVTALGRRRLATTTVDGFALTPCVYCGLPANSRDHFVPRSYRKMIEEWRKQDGWEHVPDTVPACRECNSIAGANVFKTIADKRAYVQKRLRDKNARLLASPLWEEADLQELGRTLRTHVNESERKKIILLLRLAWPYDSQVEALTLAVARGSDDPAHALNTRRREEILR